MVDFADTPAQAAFRRDVRAFIAERYEPLRAAIREEARKAREFEDTPSKKQWLKTLAAKGWIAPAWPTEYGGAGMGVLEQFTYNEEMAEAAVARPNGITVGFIGPTIITLGTDAQKREHLPPILSGERTWCQGYSEPGSGSDLASLQTRAVKDGDDWVINGQKIWTSGAHAADYMALLARTDPDAPKHKGITYLIVDMHSPGVEVRPLVNMAGAHEFNEVYFEDVRVPGRNVLGEVDRGWYGAVTTLDFERSSIGSPVGVRKSVERLIRYAREYRAEAVSVLGRRAGLRHALADRYLEAQIARLISYRIVTLQAQGQIPNYEASVGKLYAMELNQRIASTAMHVFGLHGQLWPGEDRAPRHGLYNYEYLRTVANTIEGGTSEIQRNIIAGRGLGLPRS